MAHRNIPIFIPHLGCPNQCVFCNQRSISGCQAFEKENVKTQIEQALATIPPSDEVEIAFFGGSFTGIERALMLWLLDVVLFHQKPHLFKKLWLIIIMDCLLIFMILML